VTKVSVVMAAWNASWCIERTLESVVRQTRPPHEILMCDDGSTDGTPDLVERAFGDAVTVLRFPHRNAAAARRDGLDRATGDWLAFLDADDPWRPNKLERELDYVARHPEIRLISSDGDFVSSHGVVRESWLSDYFDPVRELSGDLVPLLIERCFMLLSSTMVERKAYEEVGGLDRDMHYSYDYDLWLRVLARHPGAVLTDKLVSYWTSPGALSRNYEARYRDDLKIMRRVESGAVGVKPEIQRRAAERAASLEYDLGVLCLRSGRGAEGRERLSRARAHGSFSRKLLATAGMLAPDWALSRLKRATWLKGAVSHSRGPRGGVLGENENRGAA